MGFIDFDNDGWNDLFVANGHVYSASSTGRKLHVTYRQPSLLYRNLGDGRFEDIRATPERSSSPARRPWLRLRRLRQ